MSLACAAAFAQPSAKGPPVTVEWVAPAGCPSEATVVGEIRDLLAGSSSAQKAVFARAVVEAGPGNKWWVSLTTTSDGARYERTFSAESCEAIARATALIVALMVDPTAKAVPASVGGPPAPAASSADAGSAVLPPPAAATEAPIPPPQMVTAPPASRALPATSAPPPQPPRDRSLGLAAAAALDFGALPSPATGVEIAVVLVPRPLRFELAGAYWAPQTSSLATRPVGADFRLLTLSARGCYARLPGVSTPTVDLGVCGGAEVDRMSALGFGGSSSLSGAGTWGAFTFGPIASWSLLPWFALRMGIEAVLPLARPAFVVVRAPPDTSVPVHRASVLGGRGMLGAELRFF